MPGSPEVNGNSVAGNDLRDSPVSIPREFIDPQSEVQIETEIPITEIPVTAPPEIPIEIAIETPQMRERKKAIQLSLDRSNRFREMHAAKAAAKLAQPSVSSASPFMPLRPATVLDNDMTSKEFGGRH